MPGYRPKPPFPILNRRHPFASGLVGGWVMAEGAGNVVGDVSGYRHAGTLATGSNAPVWGSSPYGAKLAGTGDDTITIAHSPLLSLGLPFSITLLLRHTTTANTVIFEKNGNSGFSVQTGASEPGHLMTQIGGANNNNIYVADATNDGSYHVVTFVYRTIGASGGEAWLDGANRTHATRNSVIGNPVYGSDTPLYVFSRNNSFGFPGDIAAIFVHNYGLPASAIPQFHADPFAIVRPELRYWFVADAGGGGTTYDQSAAGTLTTAGSVTRATSKLLAGAIATAGGIARSIAKSFAGTVTIAGTLTRQTQKALAGVLTSSGVITRTIAKTLTGALTSTGQVVKSTSKTLAGTLTSSGALSTTRVFLQFVAGTLATAGTLTRSTSKSLSGALTSSGSISRSITKTLAGTLALVGTVARTTTKSFAGVLSFAGALASVLIEVGSIKKIALTLHARSTALTLQARSVLLTLFDRD